MATVLKTFTGESAIEALKKAKEECGESAMLVTTKQIQPKTLNKKPFGTCSLAPTQGEENPNALYYQ